MPDIFVAPDTPKDTAPQTDEQSALIDSEQKHISEITSPSKPYTSPMSRQMHLLSSFAVNPEDVTFKNQEKNEKVLLFLRQSMLTNLKWILAGIFLLSIPLFILPFVNINNLVLPARFILYFTGFYYLLVFSYIFVNFITWYFNIALITNIKIIDVEFSNLIYKNVAATKLSLIQDVDFVQVGVSENFFNYGDVLVQTAGTIDNFKFEGTPKPETAVHIIEDLIGK